MKPPKSTTGPLGPGFVYVVVAGQPRVDRTSDLSLHPDIRVEDGYPKQDGCGPRVRYVALTEAPGDVRRAA